MADPPIAFVAMKFDGDSWNDRRYLAIRDVLEEAGYDVKRGDALQSSAAVMSEVFDYLKSAEMVVIDTSGDSHNVSYELGYCHGIERDPANVVLLRNQAEPQAPFNYAHYRHLQYKNLRHLKRLLQERLSLSIPLRADDLAWVMIFDQGSVTEYGTPIVKAVVAALIDRGFAGRCEYYAGNTSVSPADYSVALGLKKPRPPHNKFGLQWFKELEACLVVQLRQSMGQAIQLLPEGSEFTSISGARESLVSRGAAQFSGDGMVRLLNPHQDDSWFKRAVVARTDPAPQGSEA